MGNLTDPKITIPWKNHNKKNVFTSLSVLFCFVFFSSLAIYALEDDWGMVLILSNAIIIAIAFTILSFIITKDKELYKATYNGTLLYFFFTLKLMIAGFYYYYYHLPFVVDQYDPAIGQGFDSIRYEFFGNVLAEYWQNTGNLFYFIDIPMEQIGYTFFAGIIYYIFGFNPFVTITINILAIIILSIVVFKFTYVLFRDEKIAKVAMILVCISPAGYLWGSLSTKDPLIALFMMVGSYSIFKIITNKKFVFNTLLLLVSLVALIYLRFGVFLVLIFTFFLSLLIIKTNQNRKMIIFLMAGPLLIVLYFFVANALMGQGIFYDPSAIFVPLGYGIKDDLVDAGWHFEEDSISYALTGDLSLNKIYLLPLKMLFVLIAPFPFWNFVNFSAFFTNFNTVLTLLLVPSFIYGVIWSFRLERKYFLIIYLSFFIGLAAISFAHIGVDFRYTFTFFPFFYMIAAVGIKYFNNYKKLFYLYLFYFIPALGFLYFIIKIILAA